MKTKILKGHRKPMKYVKDGSLNPKWVEARRQAKVAYKNSDSPRN